MSWTWWNWPFTWLTNHHPSVLWHCWFGHVTCKIDSKMIYNVLSGRYTLLYHTYVLGADRQYSVRVRGWQSSCLECRRLSSVSSAMLFVVSRRRTMTTPRRFLMTRLKIPSQLSVSSVRFLFLWQCVVVKHPLLFSCITPKILNEFEWKFQPVSLRKWWFYQALDVSNSAVIMIGFTIKDRNFIKWLWLSEKFGGMYFHKMFTNREWSLSVSLLKDKYGWCNYPKTSFSGNILIMHFSSHFFAHSQPLNEMFYRNNKSIVATALLLTSSLCCC